MADTGRFLRSPNLVGYWRGSEFILEDFVRRREISVSPLAVLLLDEFGEPQSFRAVSKRFPRYVPETVEKEAKALARLGFLVPAKATVVTRDVAAAWENSFAAAYFHYATRDVVYERDVPKRNAHFRRKRTHSPLPAVHKTYRGSRRIALPRDSKPMQKLNFDEVLDARRTVRQFSSQPVPFLDFAATIRNTWGQTGWIDAGPLGRLLLKRSPSAGARHPIECYVVAWNVEGLNAALYHYSVKTGALEELRRGKYRDEATRFAGGQPWVRDAAFLCVMTAVAPRVFWKYSSADAYRLFFLDAGHLGQTFALTATARGLGPFTTAALNESRIERFLGLDGVEEFPVYLCGAGVPASDPRMQVPAAL